MRVLWTLAILAGCGHGTIAMISGPTDMDGDGVFTPEDCDDLDSSVHPGAPELCDGLDNDCNGLVDDSPACDTAPTDADGDGYDSTVDCNDNDPTIHPGALEICGDGIDQDCDPADDNVGSTWYADADQDGYGDAGNGQNACTQPAGAVLDGTDCDDANADVHPGASETCDGLDDDCNGSIDDNAIDAPTWYADGDGDGHGNAAASTVACDQPSGTVASSDDCDDANADVHPGASETCDGLDDDCNGSIDDNAIDATTWWRDSDSDGYGDDATTVASCDLPVGYVDPSAGADCNDADASVNPGAAEIFGDGIDQNCDGSDDIWYFTGSSICISDQVFDADHASCDAYMVGQYPFDPWTALESGNLVTNGAVAAGFYCYDFHVRAAGHYEFTLVSACSATDPALAVDRYDQSDWAYADFDTYCGGYSSTSPDPLAVCFSSTHYAGFTAKVSYDGVSTLSGYGSISP